MVDVHSEAQHGGEYTRDRLAPGGLGDVLAGRLLVRWSGTEPKLRIMIEGEDQAQIAAWAQELAAAARKDVGA